MNSRPIFDCHVNVVKMVINKNLFTSSERVLKSGLYWRSYHFKMSIETVQLNNFKPLTEEVEENKSITGTTESVDDNKINSNASTDAKDSAKKRSLPFLAKKLCVLECVKIHLRIIGCMPIDSKCLPNWCGSGRFNIIHITLIFFILFINLTLTFMFHIRELHSFIDFSEAVFWASRSVLSLILYVMFIWYKTDIIKLFNDLDEMVNNRKRFSL